ncbi:tyrosine phosphatase-like protein [Crucibulum laeve]|uniref:Very-long-chain (3R)-3-hydroxyacyl-CoA dehydratase n=1 Tax=Crucibulum laeve TaxID=68775 RepID=A0A5C3MTC0_9AGAR|nr:tyrosine phosphatase-like protein [Crucibulum laeve]
MASHSIKNSPSAPPKNSKSKEASVVVKGYLVAYNVLSTVGWAYVLAVTLVHLFNLDGKSDAFGASTPKTASSTLSRFLYSFPLLKSLGIASPATIVSHLPPSLLPVYQHATTTFARVGTQTAFVQSFAILEVVHVLLGWVRSPIQTTAMQVASRLFLVWGIVEQFPDVRTNPLYASMVLAWSATEVIRYSFYACNLLGYSPSLLLYLRYTTFYALYPLGASSEAFLIYATLPASSPFPGWQSWLHGMWKPTDYVRAGLFAIWWPGLYVMYTYMIAQRRKVLGKGSLKTKAGKAN